MGRLWIVMGVFVLGCAGRVVEVDDEAGLGGAGNDHDSESGGLGGACDFSEADVFGFECGEAYTNDEGNYVRDCEKRGESYTFYWEDSRLEKN